MRVLQDVISEGPFTGQAVVLERNPLAANGKSSKLPAS